ncbi:NAD(P)/FAD-dependent oxidoreductase [Aurantiacibacter luteus]|uniref:FAD-dependent oxidoreductase n=1 Tax=Aurantiacibacter luteus TaxID=1581420 RepID=A0A0G9MST8_9SPHN|nr:FAD-dependent oxidoreductase [Aurantiacibacter luteus]KLE33786.1 FAD-dependent oxidoreductase [Aurantiacibacter luteus]
MAERFDVVIVGAGMAGASLAAELAPHAGVLIVEAESQPGYHTTGRSAAFYEECYGGPDVVPLTLASGPYLREHGFLSPRAGLYVARAGQGQAVDDFLARFADAGVTLERLDRDALEARLPGVRADWTQGLLQPHCADIDVGGLHQHYLAAARRGGAMLRTNHRLAAAEREGDGWRLDFGPAGEVRAAVLVDAAGAWADHVAQMAGAQALGVQPYRRTVMQLRTDPLPPADLPLVLDLGGEFYFRPENGRLWLSPHDEIPSDPCDAAPEEIDVALAIDRFEQVVDWRIAALEHKWAGLRSFAPDRLPVYGFDAAVPDFFWFAGQGGYGIQTAPAAARLGAQLLLGLPRDAMTERLDPRLYTPQRFAG